MHSCLRTSPILGAPTHLAAPYCGSIILRGLPLHPVGLALMWASPLTFDICTPSWRWIPAQARHMTTPRLIDAQVGFGAAQSQQQSLPATACTVASTELPPPSDKLLDGEAPQPRREAVAFCMTPIQRCISSCDCACSSSDSRGDMTSKAKSNGSERASRTVAVTTGRATHPTSRYGNEPDVRLVTESISAPSVR